MSLSYLASPYTHADPAIREQRYQAVCKKAAELMLAGKVIFCPVAHSHRIAEYMPDGMAIDAEFWTTQDAPYVEMCDELIVLRLPGWSQSKGVAHEVVRATERSIPIFYVDP